MKRKGRKAGDSRQPDAKPHDEAAEHGEHGVPGHHVGEQTDGEADGPGEVGDHLDHADERQKQRGTPDGTNSLGT